MERIDPNFYHNEYFCKCFDGQDYSYGLDCSTMYANPCSDGSQQHQQASSDSIPDNYFIHCTNKVPHLFKCPSNLIWNDVEKTCSRRRIVTESDLANQQAHLDFRHQEFQPDLTGQTDNQLNMQLPNTNSINNEQNQELTTQNNYYDLSQPSMNQLQLIIKNDGPKITEEKNLLIESHLSKLPKIKKEGLEDTNSNQNDHSDQSSFDQVLPNNNHLLAIEENLIKDQKIIDTVQSHNSKSSFNMNHQMSLPIDETIETNQNLDDQTKIDNIPTEMDKQERLIGLLNDQKIIDTVKTHNIKNNFINSNQRDEILLNSENVQEKVEMQQMLNDQKIMSTVQTNNIKNSFNIDDRSTFLSDEKLDKSNLVETSDLKQILNDQKIVQTNSNLIKESLGNNQNNVQKDLSKNLLPEINNVQRMIDQVRIKIDFSKTILPTEIRQSLENQKTINKQINSNLKETQILNEKNKINNVPVVSNNFQRIINQVRSQIENSQEINIIPSEIRQSLDDQKIIDTVQTHNIKSSFDISGQNSVQNLINSNEIMEDKLADNVSCDQKCQDRLILNRIYANIRSEKLAQNSEAQICREI